MLVIAYKENGEQYVDRVIDMVQPQETPTKKESPPASKNRSPKWETDARDRVKMAVKKFGKALSGLAEADANEADTRLFVTDFLFEALGYDKYAELSTEYRVKNEYADYAIRVDKELLAFVEVKRINTKLTAKHLRQVQTYAVNEGVEWIILTNGAQWQVYHLSGGLPLITDLAFEVDLLGDDSPGYKIGQMFYMTREAMKRHKLNELWQAKSATSPRSLSTIMLSPPVILAIRKELKKVTGYNVDASEVIRLLKETCLRSECFGR